MIYPEFITSLDALRRNGIGEAIEAARSARVLNPGHVAADAHICQTRYLQIERGEAQAGAGEIIRIAAALDTEPGTLLVGVAERAAVLTSEFQLQEGKAA